MSAWVSSLRRTAPRYEPEDGTYRAVTAPLWRRGAASAVDWVLVFFTFLIVSYPLGMIQTLGDALGGVYADAIFDLTQVVGLGIIAAYFGYFFYTGHTLGMRAFDVHVFSASTGREPHLFRASMRGLLSLGFFLAAIDAYGLSRGGLADELSSSQAQWRTVAIAGATIAVLGELWQILDPAGRTAWDRMTGLVVVEDVVPASMPDRLWSPWGT
jgi:uncharacterized RDD family membrane protein YckC